MPLFDFFQVFSSGSSPEPPKHQRSSSVASGSSVPNLQVAGGSQKNEDIIGGRRSTRTTTSPTSTSSPSIQHHQRSQSLNVIAPSSTPVHGYGHKRSLTETISTGSLLLETKEPGLHRRNSTNMLSPCTENRPKLEKWEIESLFY